MCGVRLERIYTFSKLMVRQEIVIPGCLLPCSLLCRWKNCIVCLTILQICNKEFPPALICCNDVILRGTDFSSPAAADRITSRLPRHSMLFPHVLQYPVLCCYVHCLFALTVETAKTSAVFFSPHSAQEPFHLFRKVHP